MPNKCYGSRQPAEGGEPTPRDLSPEYTVPCMVPHEGSSGRRQDRWAATWRSKKTCVKEEWMYGDYYQRCSNPKGSVIGLDRAITGGGYSRGYINRSYSQRLSVGLKWQALCDSPLKQSGNGKTVPL